MNKLKIISIAICCLVSTLRSETQGMDFVNNVTNVAINIQKNLNFDSETALTTIEFIDYKSYKDLQREEDQKSINDRLLNMEQGHLTFTHIVDQIKQENADLRQQNADLTVKLENLSQKFSLIERKYNIYYSCVFDENNRDYLYKKDYEKEGSTTKFTISMWIKRDRFGSHQVPIRLDSHKEGYFGFSFGKWNEAGSDEMGFFSRQDSRKHEKLVYLQDLKDKNWNHILICADTEVENNVKIFLNNKIILKQIFDKGLSVFGLNNNSYIGMNSNYNNNSYFSGLMADIYGIDGQCLLPDCFGRFKEGKWLPIDYQGSYGANGFHLDFSDPRNLGRDVSGNNNHWITSRFDGRQSHDTPTT